ncbi:MAG: serine hydrolase [Firmicutes bacterium]|nr:serine hydrolase [Bacillota bacterium]
MLKERLIKAAEGRGAECAFVVKDLKDGSVCAYREDEVVSSFSLIKVFILAEAVRRIRCGELALDTEIDVKASDVVDFSVLVFLKERAYTLEELLRLMIVYSDNTATNVLIDYLGYDDINKHIRDLGFEKSLLQRKMMDFEAKKEGRDNLTTAGEMAEFLERLYRKELLGAEADELMLDIMKGQADEMDMRLQLPDELPIARKSGEGDCLNHEIAIVFAESTDYIFCFLSWNGPDNNQTRQLMSDTSKIVYDFFEDK